MFITEYAIERSKAEILEDMSNGIVPTTVSSFSELHDYVDANEYGGLCSDAWFCLPEHADDLTVEANGGWLLHFEHSVAVQDAVDAWLQERNPEQAKLEAEQDAIHPYRSYYMYRGKPIH